jgi:hypothetical protein
MPGMTHAGAAERYAIPRFAAESKMDEIVVKRMKTVWLVAWLSLTGFVFVGWGFKAAAAASLAYVGVSILAFIAFILNLLLGEEHIAFRILLIALFIIGLVVELGAIGSLLGPLSPFPGG